MAVRDRYMAENAVRLLDEAPTGTKMVIWAANEHIRRDAYSMGWHLGERFGDEYYALGLAFDRGGFRVLHMSGDDPMPQPDLTIGPALQVPWTGCCGVPEWATSSSTSAVSHVQVQRPIGSLRREGYA